MIDQIPLAELLDFERQAPFEKHAKSRAIRRRFGISTLRYLHQLIMVIDRPEAMQHDPVLVSRLLKLRGARRVGHSGGSGGARASRNPRQMALDLKTAHGAAARVQSIARRAAVLAGEAAKELGMAQADLVADADWRDAVDAAIGLLAAKGEKFTAEDVRALAGDPPDHPNAMGARFNAAARRGLITKVSYRLATRESLHRHPIAVWVGSAGDEGAA